MTEYRWREIAARLDVLAASSPLGDAICHVASERLTKTRIGLTLCLGGSFSPIACTDQIAGLLDEQQFALGEGPSWDCASSSLPAAGTDLRSTQVGNAAPAARWPAFCRAAESCGTQSAFAFPLQVGLVTVAVLTAYRDHAGVLSASEYVDCLTLASLATTALLAEQTGEHAGELAEVFRAGADERAWLQRAAGMVAERESVSIVEAMLRIRAHAYAEGRPLGSTARDICDRRLVLPPEEES